MRTKIRVFGTGWRHHVKYHCLDAEIRTNCSPVNMWHSTRASAHSPLPHSPLNNRGCLFVMGSMHPLHFVLLPGLLLPSFTGVTDDTNEGSVPFWSDRVRVLLLCMLAHWKHSATPVGLKVSLSGFQIALYVCVTLESVQMEPNGPVRVHLVPPSSPFVRSQSYGGP